MHMAFYWENWRKAISLFKYINGSGNRMINLFAFTISIYTWKNRWREQGQGVYLVFKERKSFGSMAALVYAFGRNGSQLSAYENRFDSAQQCMFVCIKITFQRTQPKLALVHSMRHKLLFELSFGRSFHATPLRIWEGGMLACLAYFATLGTFENVYRWALSSFCNNNKYYSRDFY